ncbi:MAG: hypothetical protein GC205_07850 [Bacteroidetes bacterium]|nr:hypothetical protein [Bacteroidota bacterium]
MARNGILGLLLVLTCLSAKAGSGWTLNRGEAWFEGSVSSISYSELWQQSSPFLQLQRPVTDFGIRLYAEYGLLDNVTLIGQLPYRMVSTGGEPQGSADFSDTLPVGNLNYLGNYRLGARYQVFNRSQTVVSLQGIVESNNSDLNQITGLQTGFDAWSVELLVAFGKSFPRSYLAGHGGMAIRTNQYSEEFLGQLEYGVNLTGGWWLMAVADYRLSFRNGDRVPCNTRHTGLYVNNQEALSYGLKTLVPITGNIGLSAGLYGALMADNLPAAFSFNGGVYWNPQFRRSGQVQQPVPSSARARL